MKEWQKIICDSLAKCETEQELASCLDVSQQAINEWKRGLVEPHARRKKILLKKLEALERGEIKNTLAEEMFEDLEARWKAASELERDIIKAGLRAAWPAFSNKILFKLKSHDLMGNNSGVVGHKEADAA